MRKIHTIHDLRQEQHAVEQGRLQLEKELHRDWNGVKRLFSPGSDPFFDMHRKQFASKLIVQGLSFGAGILTRKFGGKIGSKLFSWLK